MKPPPHRSGSRPETVRDVYNVRDRRAHGAPDARHATVPAPPGPRVIPETAMPHASPRRRSLFPAVALLALFALTPHPGRANEAVDYRLAALRDAWCLADGFWKAQDLVGRSDDRAARALAEASLAAAKRLSAELLQAAERNDHAAAEAFLRFLAARPAPEREAYAPVVAELGKSPAARRLFGWGGGGLLPLPADPGFIPGYGTAEPGFRFARGATIETRVIGEIWHPKFQYLMVNERFRGTCAVELVGALTSERIRDLELLAPAAEEPYNGEPRRVVPTAFRMNRYWRFTTLRRFDIVRTDYELWRSPVRRFLPPRWEKVGTTHLLTESVTPEQILTGLR